MRAWGPPASCCALRWAQASAGADRLRAVGAVCVSHRTEQLGVFTHKEFEQLAPVLDGFSLMTYDYPAAQQ